jgi:hypothetical protein
MSTNNPTLPTIPSNAFTGQFPLPRLKRHLPLMPAAGDNVCPADPNIVTGWRFVHPTIAEACLAKEINCRNRTMKEHAATRHGRNMSDNAWYVHHQGIAFNIECELADGQHRLRGIVLSGTSQWTMVTWNLPVAAQMAIDDHQRRTERDVFRIRGDNYENGHIATARRMHAGATIIGGRKWTLTRLEVRDYISEYRHGIYFANELFTHKDRKINNAAVKAVIARAYYHVPTNTLPGMTGDPSVTEEKIREFVDILRAETIVIGPGAHGPEAVVVGRLRTFLKDQASSTQLGYLEIYKKVSRALRAFVDGEIIDRLYAVKGELFPLPTRVKADDDDPSEDNQESPVPEVLAGHAEVAAAQATH